MASSSTNGGASAATVVKAVYSFKGSHNDELNFRKGAIITLTQKEDGGWWEGTLDGKTGWFPSNYVKEVENGAGGGQLSKTHSGSAAEDVVVGDLAAKRLEFRQQVMRDLIDKEREFVGEMRQTLVKKYLAPLRSRTDM